VKTKQGSLFGNDSLSISRQISQATDRLDERRKNAGMLSGLLRSRVHSALASPGGLWIAGCAGFVAAEWMHRPVRGPHRASKLVSNSARRPQATALAHVVMLLKFAQDLREAWINAGPGNSARVRDDTEAQQAHARAANESNSRSTPDSVPGSRESR
jgi:hypothetical protein